MSVIVNIILPVRLNYKNQKSQVCIISKVNIIENEEKSVYANQNEYYNERENLFSNFYSYPTDIVFLGDSIIQKFEWQDVFPNLLVKNRGIGSDTTLGALSRIDSVIKTKPDKIVIMLGINDLFKKRTIDEIVITYKELLSKISDELPNATIIVNSVLPVTSPEVIKNSDIILLNFKLNEICNEQNIKFVDMFSEFTDEMGNLRTEYSLDGVHLTVAGYNVLIDILKDRI